MLNLNPFAAPTFKPGSAVSMPVVYFEDFIGGYTAVDLALANESDPTGLISPVADRGVWFVSHDALVADTQLFAPQDDADGGWIKATTDATSGERISMQINGEPFLLGLGRTLYYEARLKFTNTTQDAFFGLAVNTTDPHASAPSDYVAFGLTGDADIEVGVALASSDGGAFSGTDSTIDLVANTWTTFAFMYDGVDTVRFYVDGAEAGAKSTNVPIGKFMSPVFCVESNGAAEAMFIDYVLVANERARP